MTFTNILNFFLYVIPGFLSTEIYKRMYPAKKDSDFSRLTWSVTLSIIIFVCAKCLDQWLKLKLFAKTNDFPKTSAIAVFLILAIILAYLRIAKHKLSERFEFFAFLRTKPLSIWADVNNQEPAEWAYVTLTNGDKYLGWISKWSYDPNEREYDFLLTDAKKVNVDLEVYYEIPGQGVYLKTNNVVSIEFFGGTEGVGSSIQEQSLAEAAPAGEAE
jgi:hypothetical protein